jgi:hypothetical protein
MERGELMDEDKMAIRHTKRFRRVSTRYPRRVAEAYGGDLGQAMADNDAQVAATVAAWEKAQGLPVRDWPAIGAEERELELRKDVG